MCNFNLCILLIFKCSSRTGVQLDFFKRSRCRALVLWVLIHASQANYASCCCLCTLKAKSGLLACRILAVFILTWLQQWILTCKPCVANFSRKIKIKIVKQAIKTTLGLKQLPATMWSELCGYFPQVTLCMSLNNCIPHPAPAASYSSPGAMSHPAELGLAFNYPTLCENILQSHWLTGEQRANTNTNPQNSPHGNPAAVHLHINYQQVF